MTWLQPPYWAFERNGLRGWPQHVRCSRVTPPTEEPITLEEAKTHVKVDGPESDLELEVWIAAARQDTEVYAQRAWVEQGIDVTLSYFPWTRDPIVIPVAPLLRVTGIDYIDASGVSQTLDPSLYTWDAPQGDYAEPGRVMLAYGQFYWPFPPAMQVLNGVTIHCVCGYGTADDVPGSAKAGQKLLIGNWWQNREAGQIIRGSADFLPYGVDHLFDPFRAEVLA